MDSNCLIWGSEELYNIAGPTPIINLVMATIVIITIVLRLSFYKKKKEEN